MYLPNEYDEGEDGNLPSISFTTVSLTKGRFYKEIIMDQLQKYKRCAKGLVKKQPYE